MNDPNIDPVKLIDFDLLTLSELAVMSSGRIANLEDYIKVACSNQRVDLMNAELERMRLFYTQVLNAFSRVKESETITNS